MSGEVRVWLNRAYQKYSRLISSKPAFSRYTFLDNDITRHGSEIVEALQPVGRKLE
jgi:hypothetical protein